MIRRWSIGMVLALFVCTGVGCGPVRMNISVSLDKSFQQKYGTNKELLVDLVGVKGAENANWEQRSMTEYWSEDASTKVKHRDPSLPGLKTLTLNSKSLDPQTISVSDALWEQWLGGASCSDNPQIFVLAQLPGTWDKSDDKAGNLDPRRRILSACPKGHGMFDPPPTIHLVIGVQGMSIQ